MESDLQLWDIVHDLIDDVGIHSVVDYTFWDDMVAFAEDQLDNQWGVENLDAGIESFGLDALWVLRADGTVRYARMLNGDEIVDAPPLPLDSGELRTLMAQEPEEGTSVREFYWFSDELGPLSLFGADITTTDDSQHKKPARGYYIVAIRISERAALSDLAGLGFTGEAVEMTTIPPEERPSGTSPHVFWHRMWDHTGATIGAIKLVRTSPLLTQTLRDIAYGRMLGAVLWVLVGAVTTFLLLSLARVQQRAQKLADQMTSQLRENNEVLERRVAERTKELELDIQERTAAEENLMKRTADLERMNKVMLDRESRIIELKQKIPKPAEPGR